jgi:four helix bundle protein
MLTFQRLDVYPKAIEFLGLVYDLQAQLPRGHAERADQLVRASEAIVRNIAEGSGRWTAADSAKHYKIARGEAMECAGSIDVMRVRKIVDEATYARATELITGIVQMLTKMF